MQEAKLSQYTACIAHTHTHPRKDPGAMTRRPLKNIGGVSLSNIQAKFTHKQRGCVGTLGQSSSFQVGRRLVI